MDTDVWSSSERAQAGRGYIRGPGNWISSSNSGKSLSSTQHFYPDWQLRDTRAPCPFRRMLGCRCSSNYLRHEHHLVHRIFVCLITLTLPILTKQTSSHQPEHSHRSDFSERYLRDLRMEAQMTARHHCRSKFWLALAFCGNPLWSILSPRY